MFEPQSFQLKENTKMLMFHSEKLLEEKLKGFSSFENKL